MKDRIPPAAPLLPEHDWAAVLKHDAGGNREQDGREHQQADEADRDIDQPFTG
ncbi:hypothetical protein GCM10028778_17820 [Barrientosiimonas marina]